MAVGGKCGAQNATHCVGDRTLESATTAVRESLNNLRSRCNSAEEEDEEDDDDDKKRRTAAAIGAGVTSVAGGILGWQITKSIQDASLNAAEQAAITEFMDNVGSKIRCYIGPDEVGMYGDVISTSME